MFVDSRLPAAVIGHPLLSLELCRVITVVLWREGLGWASLISVPGIESDTLNLVCRRRGLCLVSELSWCPASP